MIALGGAVWAALTMFDSEQTVDTYNHHQEPLTYDCDVVYRFEILSDLGKNVKNILKSQLDKETSEALRYFRPEYEMIEEGNLLELRMIKSPYKLYHSQVIELLENHNLKAGVDYNLTWFLGEWNRKTKEFSLY